MGLIGQGRGQNETEGQADALGNCPSLHLSAMRDAIPKHQKRRALLFDPLPRGQPPASGDRRAQV
jgi:hypothetical protein